MKTYKQELLKSPNFLIAIASPILVSFICVNFVIIWDTSFFVAIWPILLLIIGMTLIKFSQLWYVTVDEKEFWVNNGVFRSDENLYRYDTLYKVYFGHSYWYGLYVKVLRNDNRKRTYPLLLVKSSDIKKIINDLQERGVIIDSSKLPEKYK